MNIGKSIKIMQARAGYSGNELANKLGVTPSYLSHLKNKEDCSPEMLRRLSAVFNVKESDFIKEGEE